MNALFSLIRRHVIESRWMLGTITTAFFGLAILTTWLTMRFEKLIEANETGKDIRRLGFLRGLGGPAMDNSTLALEILWWNHPVIILSVLSWAISRGSAAVAGEIERGTIDVTLTRPVSRSAYLTSQIAFAVLGLLIMVCALIAGLQTGALIWPLKTPPSVLAQAKPAAMVLTLGMAVFGYTLPFSASDVVRWRATLAAVALTLGGLIGMSVAPIYEEYRWLENFSVFQVYAPVTVAVKGEPLLYNCTVLLLVFGVGCLISYVLFARRDIPSNS